MSTSLSFHDAAGIFPMMDAARYAELVADIGTNGLVHPIVLCDGKILDGRNRYRACLEAKVEPKFIDFAGNPFDYAWSANAQRRDLVAEQRAAIWLEANERSEAWRAEQDRMERAANEKRSDAQRGIPKADKERAATTCGSTFKASTAAAKASNTNRGAIERQQTLRTKRPDLAAKVRSGDIKPTEALRQMKKGQVVERIAALPEGKYRVIYADPPWDYKNEFDVAGYTTVAGTDHYPVMPLSEICALDVKSLAAPDSVLLLWATTPLLPQPFEVIKAWGFTYKQLFVWNKGRGGFGSYHKANCELLLIATRGSCVPDADERADQMQSFARGPSQPQA
jgi:hypothetical protein